LRNATIKIEYAGTAFLVDPTLGEAAWFAGFSGTPSSELRNPLVPLPVALSEAMQADAVVAIHLHPDR
jgi:L-ascorbate metabolism protein UlaG (beta-lactamase superfamily)